MQSALDRLCPDKDLKRVMSTASFIELKRLVTEKKMTQDVIEVPLKKIRLKIHAKRMKRRYPEVTNIQHIYRETFKKYKAPRTLTDGTKVVAKRPNSSLIYTGKMRQGKVVFDNLYGYDYRTLCCIARSWAFREKKCCPGGESACGREEKGVCCQATTMRGTRCRNKASKYLQYDIGKMTSPDQLQKIYDSLPSQKTLVISSSKMATISRKLTCVNCCFYCWQHAAIGSVKVGVTYLTSYAWVLVNIDSILRIFFDNPTFVYAGTIAVAPKKLGRLNSPPVIAQRYIDYFKASGFVMQFDYFFSLFITILFLSVSSPLVKALDKVFQKRGIEVFRVMQLQVFRLLHLFAGSKKSAHIFLKTLKY